MDFGSYNNQTLFQLSPSLGGESTRSAAATTQSASAGTQSASAGNPFPSVGNEHTCGGNQTFYVYGGNQTSQCFDATESASQGGLVAAALAHPSAIREKQSRAECVIVTELKKLMKTFATWCPCSDVHKISVLLHGIIYQDKPLTVVEAGKCLELVESSIKAMLQKPFGCGPEKFKQLVPEFKKLYKMRNQSSHATMVPAPDYNEVIRLLAIVLNSYHEKYFVREFGHCRADRQCHDPKCPKREECLKQQQEYLRPSASCVAASVQEQDIELIEQIIRDEENRRERLAKEPPSYCVRNDDEDGYDFCREDGKSLNEVCSEARDEVRATHQPVVCYAHYGKLKDFCYGCGGGDCPDCSGPDGEYFNDKESWMFKFGRKRWELLYGWRSDISQEEKPGCWDEMVEEYREYEAAAEEERPKQGIMEPSYDKRQFKLLAQILKDKDNICIDAFTQDWLHFIQEQMSSLLKRIKTCTKKKHLKSIHKSVLLVVKAARIMHENAGGGRFGLIRVTLATAWTDQLKQCSIKSFGCSAYLRDIVWHYKYKMRIQAEKTSE